MHYDINACNCGFMKLCYTVLVPCTVDAEGIILWLYLCVLGLFEGTIVVNYIYLNVKTTSLALFQAFAA